jgi:uncharacterized protein
MIYLIDANVLVALHNEANDDFLRAHEWFASLGNDQFATCAITQGGFLRTHLIYFPTDGVVAAFEKIKQLTQLPHHVWWGDDLSYVQVDPKQLQGRKQITDAWLAQLCRIKKGKIITFDKGLSILHADVAILL